MERRVMFAVIAVCAVLMLSLSLVSASIFTDIWDAITGKPRLSPTPTPDGDSGEFTKTCAETCDELYGTSGQCRTWSVVPSPPNCVYYDEYDAKETSDCHAPSGATGSTTHCCCEKEAEWKYCMMDSSGAIIGPFGQGYPDGEECITKKANDDLCYITDTIAHTPYNFNVEFCDYGCADGECITGGSSYVDGCGYLDDDVINEMNKVQETVKLSIGGSYPSKVELVIGSSEATVELISASDTSATVKITYLGSTQTKEIVEGDSKSVAGASIYVESADESNFGMVATITASIVTLKEGVKIMEGSFAVVPGDKSDGGYFIYLSNIFNSTGTPMNRYSDDTVEFVNMLNTQQTYEAKITSEGRGTVTIGGKSYQLIYWDDKAGNNKAYVLMYFPVTSGQQRMVFYDCEAEEPSVNETTCTDSDGGKNYYVKGETKWGSSGMHVDYCVDNIKLDEGFCHEDGIGGSVIIDCPEGCEGGKCIEGGQSYVDGCGYLGDDVINEMNKLKETVKLSVGGDYPSNTEIYFGSDKAVIQLISASDTAASVRVTYRSNTQTKEINEGDTKVLAGVSITVDAADESSFGLYATFTASVVTLKEGQKTLKMNYVVVPGSKTDDGYLLRLTILSNSTSGYASDKIEFTNVLNVNKIFIAKITSEGRGTITLGGMDYQLTYWDDKSGTDNAYVTLNFPVTGDEQMVFYDCSGSGLQVCQGLINNPVLETEIGNYILSEVENNSYFSHEFGGNVDIFLANYENVESLGEYLMVGVVVLEDKTAKMKDTAWLNEVKFAYKSWTGDYIWGNEQEWYYIIGEKGMHARFWYNQNVLVLVQYINSYDFRSKDVDIEDFASKLKNNEFEIVGKQSIDWEVSELTTKYITKCESTVDEPCWPFWAYKIEPVVCPPHGMQTEIWDDYNGCFDNMEITTQCSPGICAGCIGPRWMGYKGKGSDNICVPYGTRLQNLEEEETRLYEDYQSDDYTLEVFSDNEAILIIHYGEENYSYSLVEEERVFLNIPGWDAGDFVIYVKDIYYSGKPGEENYVDMEISYTFDAYCNYNGRIFMQKSDGITCQNNYECQSNSCSGGECLVSQNNFQRFLANILCRLGSVVGINYDSCMADAGFS